jgi:phospholipase/carboxylesterase
MTQDPHNPQPVYSAGAAIDKAKAAMIMVHGRGASAEDILGIAAELPNPNFIFLAPQAAGAQWYPNRFIVPTRQNQPWLDSALAKVDSLVTQVTSAGIPANRVFLLGFSQGACLALEYGARHPQRYGGLIGLSGGLIGADDEPRNDSGSLGDTPVFLGCSDVDFHIPAYRVEKTAEVLKSLGGNVTIRLYPGMGHTVNEDEIAFVKGMMSA